LEKTRQQKSQTGNKPIWLFGIQIKKPAIGLVYGFFKMALSVAIVKMISN
jgi:hypothetical protein